MPWSAAQHSQQQQQQITSETLPEYRSALDAAVKDIVGASNWIPANEVDYLKAANEEFADFIDNAGDKCLSMINSLVAMFDVNATLRKRDTLFEDKDDLVDGFDNIVDVVDGLLEKADICLDELSGKRGTPNAVGTGVTNTGPVVVQVTTGSSTNDKSKSSLSRKKVYNVVHAQNITRPQLAFKDKVDNSSTTPFIRKIQYKPNAKRPLDYGLPGSADISPEMSDHLRTLGITDASSSYFNLPHPYEYEIQTLEYPAEMFQRNRPDQLYASMSETPFTWIDTEEKLDQLASLLDGVTEIAIDTEAHDYRSFQGFVCLVQISTRKEDFIVDTLLLRHHMHVLNTSFTNPNIVKVFHGAESDIIWLQRDFGLYIVNLFDTYHASHLLEMSHHSLSFLLKYYCDVEADKQYQLADWRIRPLPVEMLHYARSDTHYLLYIYDRMRNELLTNSNETGNLLRATLERSAETSLQRYEKDLYDSENGAGPMGWSNAIRKFGGANSPTHLSVFKAIHMWRDHIAREEDESLRYVLPNHMLYTLSVKQPVTQQGVLACCSPVPPLVRLYASDLALLIEEAVKGAERRRQNTAVANQAAKMKEAVHIKFDESSETAQKIIHEPLEPARMPMELATAPLMTESKIFGKRGVAKVEIANVSIFTTPPPSAVDGHDGYDNEQLLAARKKADEIRKHLVLIAPRLIVKRKAESNAEAAWQTVGKKLKTSLNESKEDNSLPEKVGDSEDVDMEVDDDAEQESAPADGGVVKRDAYVWEKNATPSGTSTPSNVIPTTTLVLPGSSPAEGEDMQVLNVKRKKSKKNKKSQSAENTPASSPSGSPSRPIEDNTGKKKKKKSKKVIEEGEIVPFDYSAAASTSSATKNKEIEVVVISDDEESGEIVMAPKKPKKTKVKQAAPFNPYGSGESVVKETRAPRANLRPKSGGRSGTFAG